MGGAGESRMTVAPAEEARRRRAARRSAIASRCRSATTTSRSCASIVRPKTARRWLPARAARGARRRLPARRRERRAVAVPPLADYAQFALHADGKEMSTTMAAVRLLQRPAARTRRSARASCRSSPTRRARSAWRTCSARSASIRPSGSSTSRRTPARCSTTARRTTASCSRKASPRRARCRRGSRPRTSYSVHGLPMLPFYIYYSMFGFQRVGDLIWAAADQRARGFLLGATAGRTTLGGEGLQHQDGSSHVIAATMPNCRAYDPAFACELAVIVDHGMRADDGAAGRRVLLHHRDERELRAAVAARRRRAARHQGHVPPRDRQDAANREGQGAAARSAARSCAR